MVRLAFVLCLVLVGCALSLVTSRYELRWATIELERARSAERDLDVAWRRLQLDLTDYAQHARIDSAARQALQMKPVSPDSILYVRPDGTIAQPVKGGHE
ncbi:cell division protein FtsL [Verticiella sediminum]|uniref:Cell division protein FtsL n=1 Tax=Verticiella sediminum TaxID=1247510 RepID=A0A556A8C6_9BURK|nr:cell division protein FtsL [Verticiella sediminum]TSH89139.1 cell division protein FtsL [Verticiella sediminum]